MGKSIKETMQEFTVNQALNYLEGNPEENIPKLMAFCGPPDAERLVHEPEKRDQKIY